MAPNSNNNDQDWFKQQGQSAGGADPLAQQDVNSGNESGNLGVNGAPSDQLPPAQPRVPVGDAQQSQFGATPVQANTFSETLSSESPANGSFQQGTNPAPFYPPHVAEKKPFWTKGKKILFGSIAAVLVLLLAGGVAAYAYYNAPDKVVGDALSKSLLADTSQVKGLFKVSGQSEGAQGSADINFDMKSNKDAFQINTAIDVNVAPMSIKLSGSMQSDKDDNLYFKIDNVKQIFNNFLGAEYDSSDPAFDGINGIVDMVDNKWIKVTKDDILESATEEEKQAYECGNKLANDLYTDKSLRQEVEKAYRQNIFVKSEALDSDNFSVLHYKVTLDEQKAKDFTKAFEATKLYDRIKECDKEFEISTEDVGEAVREINKATIEVWIDRWSHELTKVSLKVKENDVDISLTADTTFNEPVTISTPTETTPFKDLMTEIEEVFGNMFSGYSDDMLYTEEQDLITSNGETNQSVLGARNWQLFNWR